MLPVQLDPISILPNTVGGVIGFLEKIGEARCVFTPFIQAPPYSLYVYRSFLATKLENIRKYR